MTVTTPSERVAPESFDDLYDSARQNIFQVLSLTFGNQDLATEATDVGFTRWRRKMRTPAHVPPDVGVMRLAYKWGRRQLGKKGRSLHGFRLAPETQDADATVLQRFNRLDVDERAILVMQELLGWTDPEIVHAIDAEGVGAASRALIDRLDSEGLDEARLRAALQAAAANYATPLSRLDSVKTKGTAQRIGAFVGGAAIVTAAVAGGAAVVNGLGGDPSDPGPAPSSSIAAATGLTGENAVWQQVPVPFSGDNIMTLTHDGTNFMMLANDNQGRVVMMRSDNGIDWAPMAAPAADQDLYFQHLVAGHGKLVAVANGFGGPRGVERTIVFTSVDGETWSRVELPVEDSVEIGGRTVSLYTFVSSVDIKEDGITVLGNQGAEFDPEQLLRGLVDDELFRHGYGTSPDGVEFFDNQGDVVETLSWDELGLDPALSDLLSGQRPVQWQSADGVEWSAVETSAPPGTQGVGYYARNENVEAALAWGNFGSSVWVKTGDEWQRPDLGASLTAMTSHQGRIIVTGAKSTGEPGLWATVDGVTWDELAPPPGNIVQFYSSPTGVIGFAWDQALPGLGPAEVAVDDMKVLIGADGRFTVLDGNGDTIVEVFEDGVTSGDTVTISDPDSGEVVVEFERSQLDAAWEAVYREAEFVGRDGPPQVTILISTDLETWTALEPADSNFFPNAVAYGNDTLVLVGWSEGGGVIGFGGGGQRLYVATPG